MGDPLRDTPEPPSGQRSEEQGEDAKMKDIGFERRQTPDEAIKGVTDAAKKRRMMDIYKNVHNYNQDQ